MPNKAAQTILCLVAVMCHCVLDLPNMVQLFQRCINKMNDIFRSLLSATSVVGEDRTLTGKIKFISFELLLRYKNAAREGGQVILLVIRC